MKKITSQIILESLFVGMFHRFEEKMKTPLVTKANQITKLFKALITVLNLKI